jgi:prepilin signal peptidase PulO-like enzyme (type II secretory pathway)
MLIHLAIIFVVSAFVGGQINRAIYRLAWTKRPISPWSEAPESSRPRTWLDCIPVVGWWAMRRESDLHGTGFWLRPMLIELSLAGGLATLYWLEMKQALYPIGAAQPSDLVIQQQFLSHAILICLLTVATFIDLDEETIPDEITFPGILIGLILAATIPQSLLPAWRSFFIPIQTEPLWLTMPNPWAPVLDEVTGLWIGLASVLGFWYAFLPKTLWYRSGAIKFIQYLIVSIFRHAYRHPSSLVISATAIVMATGVGIVWWLGSLAWQGLLTALVGMAIGGSIIWGIRIVASLALGQEAMGFGDVTLMGMIGAFVGWQSSSIIFFLAPFTGVVIAVLQWLFTGRKHIAYGPFLSLATLLAILFWPSVWSRWGLPVFRHGWIIPIVLTFLLLMMGIVLMIVGRVRRLLDG